MLSINLLTIYEPLLTISEPFRANSLQTHWYKRHWYEKLILSKVHDPMQI